LNQNLVEIYYTLPQGKKLPLRKVLNVRLETGEML